MPARSHYDVLGVAPSADTDTIRAAYRRLARDHHPDRVATTSAAGGTNMPAINEAYRILNDPGRRALYDRARSGGAATATTAATSARSSAAPESEERWNIGADRHVRPARVPWRSLLVAGTVAVFSIVVLAQFVQPSGPQPPDGILRNGDCIEVLPNNDAREIACTGSSDLVVRAFNPTFDAVCPGGTAKHRDRLGMGVACIETVDAAVEN